MRAHGGSPVKLRSSSLDDVFQQLQVTLDDDGGRAARLMRSTYTLAYRLLKASMLTTLRLPWRRGGQ
jgi:hypothetical protein